MISSSMSKETNTINPRKFSLWVLIISMIMLFAAFTSAYIVRRGDGNWDVFDLPIQFRYTLYIAIISSITMQWAYWAARRDEFFQLRLALFITLALGFAFCYGQWMGWQEMISNNVFFTGTTNPAGAFVYVISGVHAAHVIGGIIYLLVMFIQSLRMKVHKTNLLHLSMCKTYWHFVGILWIYLYLFLFLNR